MKKIAVILKRALMIWGAVSLLGIIVFYATIAYQIGTRTTRVVKNDDQDVRFVLEWSGLSQDHEVKIEHSYNPTGSWSGDYTKAFAMKLVHIEESEIMQRHGVSRGDKLIPIVRDAVEFVTNFTDDYQMPWLPNREQILSSEYYVYPVRMVHQGLYPDSVHIMFIRPADKMIFFVAVKI